MKAHVTRKGHWVQVSLLLSALFFLVDELFMRVLNVFPAEYRLAIHRTALFTIVAVFIFLTQFALFRLRLVNQQLVHSGRLSALGEMSAMFTHELVRPLTQLDLFIQIQMMEPLQAPEVKMFCQEVSRHLDRAKNLVQSLRSFGKSSAESAKTLQSINNIVNEALTITGPYLQFTDITRNLADDLPPVACVSFQIEQVLTNILINAKDALRDVKRPRIAIRTQLQASHVCIHVEDNGPGIDKRHQKKIFEPFFTTKPGKEGTGLGLAISHKIVKEHGGQLAVESRPGCTRFIIRLPAYLTEPAEHPDVADRSIRSGA